MPPPSWLTPARQKGVLGIIASGGVYALARSWLKERGAIRSSSKDAQHHKDKDKAKSEKKKPKYSKALTQAAVFKLIDFTNDFKGKARLLGILACTVIFVLVDLRKARLQGELFKSVFLGDRRKFGSLLFENLLTEMTITVFNKLLANNVSRLAMHWQSRIIKKIHDMYFRDLAYYRVQAAGPQDRLSSEVPLLTRKLALIACDSINASLQFFFYAYQIFRFKGDKMAGMAPVLVGAPILYTLSAIGIMTKLSPNFAALDKKTKELESDYRQVQSRLQSSAEAIALYGGEKYEKDELEKSFAGLYKHMKDKIFSTWWFDVVRAYIVKYCQTTFMMVLVVGPFFTGKRGQSTKDSANVLFEMRYLGDLILHQFYALGQLARMLILLQNLGGLFDRVGGLALEIQDLRKEREEQAKEGGGRIVDGDIIAFDNVTIVTPSGNQLCEGLTFDVKPQEHLIVCGPNGAGKSSIFRCLGTLWPIPKGTITRPGGNKEGLISDVYYLPQKPYNVLGDLKDQITYPDPPEGQKDLTPDRLRKLLRMVELEYLMSMSAEEVVNWEDKLSLGETQRLAMARLFWHKPKYAILDECTSAVSLEMEKRLFITCRRMGITLITISHRPALQEYHNRMLVLDGAGGWSLSAIASAQTPEDKLKSLGSTRRDSLESIMEELDGKMTSHTKQGASLQAANTLESSRGLWARLFHLNSLMFNDWREETLSLGSLAALVIVRTVLSNSIAHMNGDALKLMLAQDTSGFGKLIVLALVQGMGQALLAPTLNHLQSLMSLQWRKRLTEYITERYMKHQAYFKLKETMPDLAEIGQIDQVLAEDVSLLTEGVAELWQEFVKPCVDIVWFAHSMWMLTGWQGLRWQYIFLVSGTLFLRLVRPNLASLTAEREKLDGQFRFVHDRLRTHKEAIAFFNGGSAEKRIIDQHFDKKMKHQIVAKRAEHIYAVSQQFVAYFLPQNVVWAMSMLYQQQYTKNKVVANLSMEEQGTLSHDLRFLGTIVNTSFSSFGSIMALYGKTEMLIGHVHRVSKLIEALDKAEMMASSEHAITTGDTGKITLQAGSDVIEYIDADILTPNHTQTLAKGLSFKLTRGVDVGLLVTGPNGSGKSSVFRMLCNLWPLHRGQVSAPMPKLDVLFIPTQPYMPRGTLADQVTYPLRMVHPLDATTKQRIEDILDLVKLRYLHEREGLDMYSDSFENMLSLGEQQRLNVARVFWHTPRFVCLDECTSAVALDGEEEIYSHLAAAGCTALTASQKPWLMNFHSAILHLTADGKGGWTFKQIDETMRFTGVTRLAATAYVDKRQN